MTPTIDTLSSPPPPAPDNVHYGCPVSSVGLHQLAGRTLNLQAIPNPLWFAPTIDARLKIEQPFCVRVAHDGGTATAVVEEINEFGYGAHAGDALSDLGKTIAELYFSLEKATDLSDDLARVRAILQAHIRRVHP
ncbi:MAG: hypothetical protein ACLQVN_20105 [Bryobacteraceae bacterium]